MRKLNTNASMGAVMAFAALTLLAVSGHAQEPQEAGDPDKYLLLSTSRTGTMEEELNAAGARGYRVAGAQGGETAFGGNEAVVIMRAGPRRAAIPVHPAGDEPHRHHAGRAERGAP